jgi:hypothetical protein
MADEAQPISTPESFQDKLPNRVIVIGLMLVLLIVVIGTTVLVALGKDAPSELTQIAMPIISGVCGFYAGQVQAQQKQSSR